MMVSAQEIYDLLIQLTVHTVPGHWGEFRIEPTIVGCSSIIHAVKRLC